MHGKPGSKSTEARPFDAIKGPLGIVIANLKGHDAFTWSPKSNLQYNVKILKQALCLFWELVEGNGHFRPDIPVYLIATTCNKDISVNIVLRRAYEKLVKITNQPLIGYWFDDDGDAYLDTVLVAQFINEDKAIEVAKEYEQDEIIRIRPNGRYATIRIT